MAQDLKGSRRITKITSHLGGGAALDEISSQSLVHAVFGVGGFQEKVTAFA
jgi:hypothetical protein